jgi:hypothetical protein
LKLFAKTVPYSSSYLVFVWALLRAVALGVIVILIGRYVAVPLAIEPARILGGLTVFILPMLLIDRDLKIRYGVTSGTFGVGFKSVLATFGTSAVISLGLIAVALMLAHA